MVSVSVCLGASGDIRKCLDLAQETPKLSRRSGHQLERFLLRRAQEMLRDQATLDQEYCLLLTFAFLNSILEIMVNWVVDLCYMIK